MIVGGLLVEEALLLEVVLLMLLVEMALLVAQVLLPVEVVMLVEVIFRGRWCCCGGSVTKFDHIITRCRANTNTISLE
jgi:hypothetical protein